MTFLLAAIGDDVMGCFKTFVGLVTVVLLLTTVTDAGNP
jgi:hypothetical protein